MLARVRRLEPNGILSRSLIRIDGGSLRRAPGRMFSVAVCNCGVLGEFSGGGCIASVGLVHCSGDHVIFFRARDQRVGLASRPRGAGGAGLQHLSCSALHFRFFFNVRVLKQGRAKGELLWLSRAHWLASAAVLSKLQYLFGHALGSRPQSMAGPQERPQVSCLTCVLGELRLSCGQWLASSGRSNG